MQKSTLYFDACGTIQIVTALDVEIKATLFRARIALLQKARHKGCIENWYWSSSSPSLFAMRNSNQIALETLDSHK